MNMNDFVWMSVFFAYSSDDDLSQSFKIKYVKLIEHVQNIGNIVIKEKQTEFSVFY